MALKKEAMNKALIPKYEPNIIAEEYIVMSEKSSFKKGNTEYTEIFPNNPKVSDKEISNELKMHFLMVLQGIIF